MAMKVCGSRKRAELRWAADELITPSARYCYVPA